MSPKLCLFKRKKKKLTTQNTKNTPLQIPTSSKTRVTKAVLKSESKYGDNFLESPDSRRNELTTESTGEVGGNRTLPHLQKGLNLAPIRDNPLTTGEVNQGRGRWTQRELGGVRILATPEAILTSTTGAP